MPKIKIHINKKKIFKFLLFALCIGILIAVPAMAAVDRKAEADSKDMVVLSLWQIDGFEGGKGSRAAYLQDIADEFSKKNGCYITVNSLSPNAARLNINAGTVPDLISYAAGMYGIESIICGDKPYYNWCHGGYCFLSVDESANFEDISSENLVINGGTDNLVAAAALLCGVNGAKIEKPTGAYVKLLNGEYKYLLGTQRDIFRLRTRGASFKIKPVTEFNDLYQNISVSCTGNKKKSYAQKFIDFLSEQREKVEKLGLMSAGQNIYDDELHCMEGLEYNNKLTTPISESMRKEIELAITNCDIKLLKNLLN